MSKGKFALGALFGVAAGFVTGILTAPKSGKETRQEIKDASVKAKDTAVSTAKDIKSKAEGVVQDVRGKVESVVDDTIENAQNLRDRAGQAAESAKKGFNKKPNTKK